MDGRRYSGPWVLAARRPRNRQYINPPPVALQKTTGGEDLESQAMVNWLKSCKSITSQPTVVTLAPEGPVLSQSRNSSTAPGSPQATTSTDPPGRFSACPVRPSRSACSRVEARASATRPEIQIDADDLGDPEKMAQYQAAQNQLGSALSRLLVSYIQLSMALLPVFVLMTVKKCPAEDSTGY